MAEDCSWYNLVCRGKNAAGDAVEGAAGNALESMAREVTAGVIDTVASMGVLWTGVDSADLTAAGGETATEAPARGTFEAQMDTLLGYAAWIGFGVAGMGIIFLGIILAMNARRGEGQGVINRATMICVGAIVMGSASSLVGFLVPGRSLNVSGPVAFVQDQMLYLTLALAVLSMIIAGAKTAFTMRAEPAVDLVKSLLTLIVVSAAGVVIVNTLAVGTDALARQIIDSSVGSDTFRTEVVALLGIAEEGQEAAVGEGEQTLTWLGGSVVLIIIGGAITIIINIIQLALMALRTAMLILMAGVLPLSAAFLNTETGRNWFSKVVAWTLAFLFYKPAAALIYATAIKISTTGIWESDSDGGLLQFAGGLIMIVASVFALPVLIGFLSPVMGAMASSGGGMGMAMGGLAAAGGAAASGASRGPRSGRGFGGGDGGSSAAKSGAEGADTAKAGGKAAGGAGLAGGKVGMALAAGKAAMNAVRGGSDAAKGATAEAAGTADGSQAGSGSSPSSPGGGSQDQGPSVSQDQGAPSSGEQVPSGQSTGAAPAGASGAGQRASGRGSGGGRRSRATGGGGASGGSGAGAAPSGGGRSRSGAGAAPSGGGAAGGPSRSGSSAASSSGGGNAGPAAPSPADQPSGAAPLGRPAPSGASGGSGAGTVPTGAGAAGGPSGSTADRSDTGASAGPQRPAQGRTLRDLNNTMNNGQTRKGGPDGANRI